MLFIAEPKSASTSLHELIYDEMKREGWFYCVSSSYGYEKKKIQKLIEALFKKNLPLSNFINEKALNLPIYRILEPHGMRNETLKLLQLLTRSKSIVKAHLPPTKPNIEKLRRTGAKICILLRDPFKAYESQLRYMKDLKITGPDQENPKLLRAFKHFYNGWRKYESDPNFLIVHFEDLTKDVLTADREIRRVLTHYGFKKLAPPEELYLLGKKNQSKAS
ncbi:hypothetical protein AB751O23_AX_00120 [Chlamydiales bacterium SCGC AB-751-O23]|jgi:hypothetical protein|nr:hypothetical protein AB751O23_AX_00120 [Chlamydiales bacterium SCGC AB-751-O23]